MCELQDSQIMTWDPVNQVKEAATAVIPQSSNAPTLVPTQSPTEPPTIANSVKNPTAIKSGANNPHQATSTAVSHTTTRARTTPAAQRSEEHTSELQSRGHLVCRLLP